MEPLESTQSAANAIARVKYSHDAMIDLIIADPRITQNQLAQAFGYTVPWVSRVMCSDAFQARLADRRTEIINPELVATVEERLRELATKSLDVIQKKLELCPDAEVALEALKISTKALGFGARPQNVALQQNFVVALPGKAASAEAWASAHGPSVQIVDVQTVEVGNE